MNFPAPEVNFMKNRSFPAIVIAAFVVFGFLTAGLSAQTLKTKAEATEYKATSRHADVKAFITELQKISPLVRVETIGKTGGGWDIPALIVANPPVANPEELRRDRRGVIYIQANIHAGEVEGKEAALMLARDIVTAEKMPYLDKIVLVIVPNLNADGNERINPKNRTHQPGPAEGVGIRTNDLNLDLNRDGMKIESPEIGAVVKNVFLRWDPLIFVDCHTTNGSYHQEVVTYAWGVSPNGDPAIRTYMSDVLMPAVDVIAEKKYKTLTCGYGGFRDGKDPQKGWETLDPQPRYATNYFALRNRLSILVENYVYADFKTRVLGNYFYLKSILDYAYDHFDEIKTLTAEADARSVRKGLNPGPNDVFGLEFDLRPVKEPLTVHAYVMETVPAKEGQRPQRGRPTDKVEVHTVPYYSDFFIKRSVAFPAAYLIPVPEPSAVNVLRRHGIAVERLTEAASLEVESFKIKEIKAAERLYQGHRTNTIKGEYVKEKIDLPAGTYFVSTAQPLGNLAAYLLEPESDDGLVVWNYFDKFLASSWGGGGAGMAVPIYRLLKPVTLAKEIIR